MSSAETFSELNKSGLFIQNSAFIDGEWVKSDNTFDVYGTTLSFSLVALQSVSDSFQLFRALYSDGPWHRGKLRHDCHANRYSERTRRPTKILHRDNSFNPRFNTHQMARSGHGQYK